MWEQLFAPTYNYMCLRPKWIYKKGFYKEDNYRGTQGEFYEIGTFSKCGVCEQCIAERANNWLVRNYYENKMHERKCFVTLTYKENPIILVRKDIQDFMKRLRIELDRTGQDKVRMFYAGEFGERNGRPHNHIILYGFDDKKAKYKGINKKGNLYYESEIIADNWNLGRTSYQPFDTHEIPYISLYNTANQEFKKSYLLTREKIKSIQRNIEPRAWRMEDNARKNLYAELERLYHELESEKKKYTAVKEYNGWSKALGWEAFFEEYSKSNRYVFEEYIEDKIFVTPTPWLKKLANKYGDINATQELFRREEQLQQSKNEEEERTKNELKIANRRKKEIMDYIDTKNTVEEL